MNVGTHRRYVRASDRRLAEVAAQAAARLNLKALKHHQRLESTSIVSKRGPDGTVVTATNVIECSLAEIRRVLSSPTSERYAWVMRELLGQDFIYGAIVHSAVDPSPQDLTVRTATFLKRHLLARNEQWCFVNTIKAVEKTPDPSEMQGFTVMLASLNPDDVFIGKAQAASVIHIQGLSAVYLVTEEPNRPVKGGKTKRAVRVTFRANVAPMPGSGRPSNVRLLFSLRHHREEPDEASNGTVLSRATQLARSVKQLQSAVRRQRLDAQVFADLEKVQPSNSRCACCTRRLRMTKHKFGTLKHKTTSSRDPKRCQLCGFLVCVRCVCSIGNDSLSHEMSESFSRGIKYSQVVHLCEHCIQRVDDADYDNFCASNDSVSSLFVEPDSPSSEPASAVIARALSQVLSDASQEERTTVVRVIKHLLSLSQTGGKATKFRADSTDLARSLGHLAHEQGFSEEIPKPTTMPVAAIPIETPSSPEADVPPLAGASGRVYPLIYTDVCEETMDDTEDAEVDKGLEGVEEAQGIVEVAQYPIPADEAHRLQWIASHPDVISYVTDLPDLQLLCSIAREELQCDATLVTIIGSKAAYVVASTDPALLRIEVPRDDSMCTHVLMHEAPLLVRYPEADIRFSSMNLVRRDNIRFYFGFPIKVTYPKDGESTAIGTFCCSKFGETQNVSESQYALVATLAEGAARIIECRAASLLAIQ
ncbi:hypothetical protein PsorP6_014802 [Peronosclerospora sorghi]|uniref:Uncharacterized protein n=1 Tax=Peronosclerospora sorghi TaxID=230839 RepID=A0ACC0VUX6_9STRA|nr:hypothetical protein PsorP6_014802 [Peronosclerospora sorghi]